MGDIVVSIGLPYVGEEVLRAEGENLIADLREVQKLLDQKFIHEIIPVGSKGVFHEVKTIAEDSGLKFVLEENLDIDTSKSAGPTTVLLSTLPSTKLHTLRGKICKPVNAIGSLQKPS